jgi:hypothetical protein
VVIEEIKGVKPVEVKISTAPPKFGEVLFSKVT